jgi:hypothetical protein
MDIMRHLFWPFLSIGILLLTLSVIAFQYTFDVRFFALSNFRDYFFTCNTALMPQSPYWNPPRCIKDYAGSALPQAIIVLALAAGGIASIAYSVTKMKLAKAVA